MNEPRSDKEVSADSQSLNSPLVRNSRFLILTFLICESCILAFGTWFAGLGPGARVASLHAQTCGKHELPDRGAEAAQESVEGLFKK